MRGDAFAAADEAEAFIGRRLDSDASDIDAADFGDALPHGLAMRTDLRRLADQREVDVADCEAMRTKLAALLGVGLEQVSIKATTTERLGFAGRGEGIAAQAAATLVPGASIGS